MCEICEAISKIVNKLFVWLGFHEPNECILKDVPIGCISCPVGLEQCESQ